MHLRLAALSFVGLCTLLFQIPIHAGIEGLPVGGRVIGMGGACAVTAVGPASVLTNPAALALSKLGGLFFYGRPFGLQDLQYAACAGSIPMTWGGFGITLQSYGSSLYRENMLAVGVGTRISDNAALGMTLRTARIQIARYGSDVALMLDAGCLLNLTDTFAWGVSMKNINHGGFGERGESAPQIFHVGFRHVPAAGLLLAVEADKDIRFPADVKAGFEITPVSRLDLRFGFGSSPSRYAMGLGIVIGILSLDYALTLHPILGATHQASITIHKSPLPRSVFRFGP